MRIQILASLFWSLGSCPPWGIHHWAGGRRAVVLIKIQALGLSPHLLKQNLSPVVVKLSPGLSAPTVCVHGLGQLPGEPHAQLC